MAPPCRSVQSAAPSGRHSSARLSARFLARGLAPILLSGFGSAPGAFAAPEMRACWVSRFEWPDPSPAAARDNIDDIMSTLKANNFNTVLFQVRGQADVHYPSPYEPWSDTYNWTNPGWDPLAYAITSAHAAGLEFHVYFNTHVMAQPVPPAAAYPRHLYHLHGPNAPGAQSWVIRDPNGATSTSDNYTWMSPGIPEASWWTRRAAIHLVKNYDIDGLHFDRIRCPGADYSYDPITVARFNGEGNPDNLGWSDFMRSQITRDLRNLYGETMLHKKHIKLSAAPFGIVFKDATTNYQGTGTQSYHQWYQDSWGWMQNHVVDFMVPQIYWQVGSAHPFEDILADWKARSGGRHVVAGSTTSGGSKSVSALLAEQSQTRTQSAAGHCVFSWSTLGAYLSAFKSAPYATAAAVPDMPWKSSPSTGYIVGWVKDSSGITLTDARVTRTGNTYKHLSAFDGFFSMLDVPPGTYTVTATKNGYGTATGSVTVTAGNVAPLNLTLTRQTPDVVVDNTQAVYAGAWSTGTASADKWSADYRFANSGTGATATYNANLPMAGNYQVQVWTPQGANRSANAPYTVNFSGGSLTYPVDQQVNGGVWVTLGTHYFTAGGGQVVIGTSGAGPTVVMADAVRFTWLNANAPVTVTLDSVASEDGHVIESGENTGAGGTVSSTGTTFAVGDDTGRRQSRGVLSFDTSAVPDGATVQKVTLQLTRSSMGSDPWTNLGTLGIAIRTGALGAGAGLGTDDFAAAVTAAGVGTVPRPGANNVTVSAALSSPGVFAVNKTGRTQLRLAFTNDDDNDSTADTVSFYSGNDTTSTARRPKLVIQYTH